MKEAKLRITEPEDAAGLLDIYKPYVLHTAITFEYEVPSLQEFEQRIRQFSAQYPYLVCEAGGELLGYAYAHRFQERAAYGWNAECSVYVSQQAAGRHIGRALYSALIRLLRQQNVVNLYGVVTHPNSRSERLHEAMGFRRAGLYRRTGYKLGGWHDVAWYEKSLGCPGEAPAPFIGIRQLPQATIAAILEEGAREILPQG